MFEDLASFGICTYTDKMPVRAEHWRNIVLTAHWVLHFQTFLVNVPWAAVCSLLLSTPCADATAVGAARCWHTCLRTAPCWEHPSTPSATPPAATARESCVYFWVHFAKGNLCVAAHRFIKEKVAFKNYASNCAKKEIIKSRMGQATWMCAFGAKTVKGITFWQRYDGAIAFFWFAFLC